MKQQEPIIYDPKNNPKGEFDWTVDESAKNMIEIAGESGRNVQATFNNVTFTITPENKEVEEVVAIFHKEAERARIAYMKSPEYKKAQEERRKREAEEKRIQAEVDNKIKNETLDTSDRTKAWNDAVAVNKGFGAGIIRFAERWGKLMQAEMREAGTELTADIIKKTEFAADNEGMSGASFSCARNLLIKTWKHGAMLGHLTGFDAKDVALARLNALDENAPLRGKQKNTPAVTRFERQQEQENKDLAARKRFNEAAIRRASKAARGN